MSHRRALCPESSWYSSGCSVPFSTSFIKPQAYPTLRLAGVATYRQGNDPRNRWDHTMVSDWRRRYARCVLRAAAEPHLREPSRLRCARCAVAESDSPAERGPPRSAAGSARPAETAAHSSPVPTAAAPPKAGAAVPLTAEVLPTVEPAPPRAEVLPTVEPAPLTAGTAALLTAE